MSCKYEGQPKQGTSVEFNSVLLRNVDTAECWSKSFEFSRHTGRTINLVLRHSIMGNGLADHIYFSRQK